MDDRALDQQAQDEKAERDILTLWMDCIRDWYPDYKTKTYFVPPVVITRVPLDVVTMAGQQVLVSKEVSSVQARLDQVPCQRVQPSDTREDLSLGLVLSCLHTLTNVKNEPMFVISHLQFSDYLGESSHSPVTKQLLRPKSLSREYRRGRFCILMIHRDQGILLGEIKSVLSNQQQVQLSPDTDQTVADRLRDAIKQLDKSEVVVREITKDLNLKFAIRKTVILPYVTVDCLKRVISNDEQLKNDLVTSLQVVSIHQALDRCLLADNLHLDESRTISFTHLQTWWKSLTHDPGDSNMTDDIYLNLLARFCGPATTISVYCPTSPRINVRTERQGVEIIGEIMTSLVLTPEQISLLTRAPTKAMLTGPPGVGKSVVLVLMALIWLGQGHGVHLVSVDNASLAATYMIQYMLRKTLHADTKESSTERRIYLHEFDFYNKESDVSQAIDTLAPDKLDPLDLCVIIDEFWTKENYMSRYIQFVADLCKRLPDVRLWAASPFRHRRPEELEEEIMTIPLRCPPAVLSEVNKGVESDSNVYAYTTNTLPTPCDGPHVIYLSHSGHTPCWPLECEMCGQSIASTIQRLGVGKTSAGVSADISTVTTGTTTDDTHISTNRGECPPLQYSDVFVLTRSLRTYDDVRDGAGCVTSQVHGVVRGLRASGIPVHVIRQGQWSTDVRDTAEAQMDKVTLACYAAVSGLERKVVVYLPHRTPGIDDEWTDEQLAVQDRLHGMSRSTAQLVVVEMPTHHPPNG